MRKNPWIARQSWPVIGLFGIVFGWLSWLTFHHWVCWILVGLGVFLIILGCIHRK